MNKRGEGAGSGLLFFIFFIMMIMIGSGIVGGVLMFYGQGYDFRATDAAGLFDKTLDCFVDEKNDFFENEFDIYETCNLNKKILSESHLILIKRLSDNEEFFIGVRDYQVRCFLEARKENINLPLCKYSEVMKNGEKYKILVGSSQNSRRVVK